MGEAQNDTDSSVCCDPSSGVYYGDPSWRGHLCEFHQGLLAGRERLEGFAAPYLRTIRAQRETVKELRDENERLRSDAESHLRKHQDALQTIKKLNANYDQRVAMCEDLEYEVAEARAEVSRLEDRLSDQALDREGLARTLTKNDQLRDDLADAREENEGLRSELSELRDERNDLERDMLAMVNRCNELEVERDKLQLDKWVADDQAKELSELQYMLGQVYEERDTLQTIKQLNKRNDEDRKKIQALESEVNEAWDEVTRLEEDEIRMLRKENESLHENVDEAEEEMRRQREAVASLTDQAREVSAAAGSLFQEVLRHSPPKPTTAELLVLSRNQSPQGPA